MSIGPPPKLFDQPLKRSGIPCPKCKDGTVVFCHGEHGAFRGCSAFPACRFNSPLRALDEVDICLGFSRPHPDDEDVKPEHFHHDIGPKD